MNSEAIDGDGFVPHSCLSLSPPSAPPQRNPPPPPPTFPSPSCCRFNVREADNNFF